MKCSAFDKLVTVVFILGLLTGVLMRGDFGWVDVVGMFVASTIFHFIRILSMKEVLKLLRK